MKLTVKLNDPVIYVDPHGIARGAILSTIWGDQSKDAEFNVARDSHGNILSTDQPDPTVNLAFVSGDPDRTDNAGCGRQIERDSSCVHMSRQSVHGRYWRRLTEGPKPGEGLSELSASLVAGVVIG